MDNIKNPAMFANPHNTVGSFSAGSLTTNTPVNYVWDASKFSSNSACAGSSCIVENNSALIVGGRKKNISRSSMQPNKTSKNSHRRRGKTIRYRRAITPHARRIVRKYKRGGSLKSIRKKKYPRRDKRTHKMCGGCGCGASQSAIAGGGNGKMLGGAAGSESALHVSFGYGLDGIRLGSDSSALASPIPFKPYLSCSK
jgi:hypothetical protein